MIPGILSSVMLSTGGGAVSGQTPDPVNWGNISGIVPPARANAAKTITGISSSIVLRVKITLAPTPGGTLTSSAGGSISMELDNYFDITVSPGGSVSFIASGGEAEATVGVYYRSAGAGESFDTLLDSFTVSLISLE